MADQTGVGRGDGVSPKNADSRLAGKVALVTGASKGIGAGIAREFAAAGASVVVNYASSAAGAERVVQDIQVRGGTAIAVQGDVSVPADVERLFARTVEAYGRFDILVNNAGVYHPQPLETVTQREIDHQLSVNVTGPIRTIQEALKYFGADGGSIINIGSLDSARAVPGMSVYAATKGAVDALTRVLAAELGPRGIRVNTLAPGGVETEGIHAAGFIGSDAETDMIGRTPPGAYRSAQGSGAGGGLLRLRRRRMGHRRAPYRLWRPASLTHPDNAGVCRPAPRDPHGDAAFDHQPLHRPHRTCDRVRGAERSCHLASLR